jgi:hypothetical protein
VLEERTVIQSAAIASNMEIVSATPLPVVLLMWLTLATIPFLAIIGLSRAQRADASKAG